MGKKSNAIATANEQDDWQTESDLRTLLEAEKIEKDPVRMKAVRKMAKAKLLEVAAIAGGSDEK